MRRIASKNWKAAPLPFEFHLALDNGEWEQALRHYHNHPYATPPVDTFDLIKSLMHKTGARVEDIKRRFSDKVKLAVSLQRRAPEEVEWGTFWAALNSGDSKTISMSLSGARIHGVSHQIAVAEACAVLLKATGERWHEQLVDAMPFGTVTRSNLVTVALERQRWDVAAELLRNVRLTRGDVQALWPLMKQFHWQHALLLVSNCPKSAVPFETVLPHLLNAGCGLEELSHHLEQAQVLGDVDVVAPLLERAAAQRDWDFVTRAMDHLADIGTITQAAFRVFSRLCELHSVEAVCTRLEGAGVPLHHITIEILEELRF